MSAAMSAPADIMMMHSVADVQGLNSITEQILANGANALAGMIARLPSAAERAAATPRNAKPALGITMFGLTTPCVQALTADLEPDYDCLVFHATGIGGRSMEALAESGLLAGAIDVTTTEVADMLVGGVFAATEDRFGAFIRQPDPLCRLGRRARHGQFRAARHGAGEVPRPQSRRPQSERHADAHDARRECRVRRDGSRERLNAMRGPVRFLMPEGGVSGIDVPGKPFHDPEADKALFEALEKTVAQTASAG